MEYTSTENLRYIRVNTVRVKIALLVSILMISNSTLQFVLEFSVLV